MQEVECKKQSKFLTLKEISGIYSIPLSTLRRWASERKFPLFKVSNRIKVSSLEFEEWFLGFKVKNNLLNTEEHFEKIN